MRLLTRTPYCLYCYGATHLTLSGFRDLYPLIFLHAETRRVFIAPATHHPNEAWVQIQAKAFLQHSKETGLETAMVMHDRDTKFTASFDDVLKAGNVLVQKADYRSPNTAAYVERFIQTLQQECLDSFVAFGERHMNHLVSEMVAHYHEERPHPAVPKTTDFIVLAMGQKPSPSGESFRFYCVELQLAGWKTIGQGPTPVSTSSTTLCG